MKRTRKKTAKKAATKKKPARKPAKKRVSKKSVAKKQAPAKKKKPAKKPAAAKTIKKRPRKMAAPSTSKPAAGSAPVGGEQIGKVVHYYTELSVAIVELTQGTLRVGETIHIKGYTTDFKQPVESMEIEHQPVTEGSSGQTFGLKVRDHARENDIVYKVPG